jgi:hypothetical protein
VFKSRPLWDGFLFALFETGNDDLLISCCDLHFLIRHVQVGDSQTHEGKSVANTIIINSRSALYERFVWRLWMEILQGNVVQVLSSPTNTKSALLKK